MTNKRITAGNRGLNARQADVLNSAFVLLKAPPFQYHSKEEDFIEICEENYPKSLSATDKSVLHIANKINACVLVLIHR